MSPLLREKFRAMVKEDGTLVINKQCFTAYMQHLLDLKGMEVNITVDKIHRNRSENQNRYYHAVICKMLADETGHTKDEIHEAMKVKFLSFEDNGIKYVRSTTDLDTKETEHYYEEIRRWAASDLNLFIPDPNQVDF
jgi:hypothetical protein